MGIFLWPNTTPGSVSRPTIPQRAVLNFRKAPDLRLGKPDVLQRPSGILDCTYLRNSVSASIGAVIGVSMNVGHTEFTRIPSLAAGQAW